METIGIELALADMETLSKCRQRAERSLKVQAAAEKKAAQAVLTALDKIEKALEQGKAARLVDLSDDEMAAIYDCHFITIKPQIYVCNTDEQGVKDAVKGAPNAYIKAVQARAAAENTEAVVICGKFEAELSGIEDINEKKEFLSELGLDMSGLEALIHAAYHKLGLATFFTAGSDECRAWTIRAGDTAPRAAGTIHTDFEKGFIKAEVYGFNDIVQYGSEAKIKEAGKYRQEGRDYVVQDGDVMFFKFNV
jgi:GTP-binding protein YchF